MSILLVETQTLPCIAVFALMLHADTVMIEACENYQKSSSRNRFTILSAQGPQNVSIPLKKGKNNAQAIRDVKISYDEAWVVKLIRQLKTNYRSAPYFDFYYDPLCQFFINNPPYLYDLNLSLLKWVNKIAQLNINITESTSYTITAQADTIDIRNRTFYGTEYRPMYDQVFTDKMGFVPNLSIIDALFCLGPATRQMINSIVHKGLSL